MAVIKKADNKLNSQFYYLRQLHLHVSVQPGPSGDVLQLYTLDKRKECDMRMRYAIERRNSICVAQPSHLCQHQTGGHKGATPDLVEFPRFHSSVLTATRMMTKLHYRSWVPVML